MPRYQKKELIRDKQGALFLQVTSASPMSWLPCAAQSLQIEVFQEQFDGDKTVSEFAFKNQPGELFYVVGDRAWPRFATPIASLRDLLENLGPEALIPCKSW